MWANWSIPLTWQTLLDVLRRNEDVFVQVWPPRRLTTCRLVCKAFLRWSRRLTVVLRLPNTSERAAVTFMRGNFAHLLVAVDRTAGIKWVKGRVPFVVELTADTMQYSCRSRKGLRKLLGNLDTMLVSSSGISHLHGEIVEFPMVPGSPEFVFIAQYVLHEPSPRQICHTLKLMLRKWPKESTLRALLDQGLSRSLEQRMVQPALLDEHIL